MANLQIATDGFNHRVLHLRLGLNRLGRSPANDFQIEHDTISGSHCEIYLADGEVRVRDCESTNGTFVNGARIQEAVLQRGQSLALGDVELLVESVEVRIGIPKFQVARAAPPVVLNDGGMMCPRHPHTRVMYKCTHCLEVMCDGCVHRLKRRGGKVLLLCTVCSHAVERLGPAPKKKRSFLALFRESVKIPFARTRRNL